MSCPPCLTSVSRTRCTAHQVMLCCAGTRAHCGQYGASREPARGQVLPITSASHSVMIPVTASSRPPEVVAIFHDVHVAAPAGTAGEFFRRIDVGRFLVAADVQ